MFRTVISISIALLLQAASPAEAAIVHWASDPVAPNETVLMIGEGFDAVPAVTLRRLPDRAGDASPSVRFEKSRLPLKTDQSLALTVPAQWSPGLYVASLDGEDQRREVLLNEPDVAWVQGDQGQSSSPGGWLRMFGRSVQAPGMTARVRLRGEGQSRELAASAGDRWQTKYDLPRDMSPGAYELDAHNGWGGDAGWQRAGEIEVRPAEAWPTLSFDVGDFGAVGDGRVDDTAAVLRAIAAAGENGGGIVRFPRGRFRLSGMIEIPRRVTLVGAGRDLTALTFVDFEAPPESLFKGEGHFAIEDMTIYAANHHNVVADRSTGTIIGPGHVRLARLRIRANRFRGHFRPDDQVRLWQAYGPRLTRIDLTAVSLGGENIQIVDSDIVGSFRSLILYRPSFALIARNRIANGRYGTYALSGADRIVFEHNEIIGADLMSSGGSVATSRPSPVATNVYVARNRFRNLQGWDREAFTSDGGGGAYYGHVRAKDLKTLELIDPFEQFQTGQSEDWAGLALYVLSGPGRGQMAQVRRSGSEVTLDRPLDPMPDPSSLVTVTWLQSNFLVVQNEFEETGPAAAFAGVSYNHVVAENVATRVTSLIANGRWYRHFQPSWFCQFLENEIVDGNAYRAGNQPGFEADEAVIALRGVQRKGNPAPLLIGGILRNNRLHANAHLEVTGGPSAATPALSGAVVEGNVVGPAQAFIRRDLGAVDVIERDNRRVERVAEPAPSRP